MSKITLDMALAMVHDEVTRAQRWPAMNSAHEGYGVLAEEFDELWDEIKVRQPDRDLQKMIKEAVQVAAMAIRFLTDVCHEPVIRK